jgi:hypothetical protein
MRTWLALLIAPLVALGQQSLMLALATPACARQTLAGLHATSALSVVVTAVSTLLALQARRRAAAEPAIEGSSGRRRLMSGIAVAIGGFSLLLALALWLPVWLLSPCVS